MSDNSQWGAATIAEPGRNDGEDERAYREFSATEMGAQLELAAGELAEHETTLADIDKRITDLREAYRHSVEPMLKQRAAVEVARLRSHNARMVLSDPTMIHGPGESPRDKAARELYEAEARLNLCLSVSERTPEPDEGRAMLVASPEGFARLTAYENARDELGAAKDKHARASKEAAKFSIQSSIGIGGVPIQTVGRERDNNMQPRETSRRELFRGI